MRDLWLKAISLERNEEYVMKLCRHFNIEISNIAYDKGCLALFFEYGINSYKCEINEKNQVLTLLKQNKCGNTKRKPYYHQVKDFDGLDVWYECLKYATRN